MSLNRVWLPTPNYSARGSGVRLVVLHTAQGARTYRELGNFFANPANEVSSHTGIDDTPGEIGEYVKPENKAWTQGNANPYSVAVELCAWAEWSAGEWAAHPVMLQNCAAWVAEECARYRLPIRRLSAAEAQGGGAGVCDHNALGAAGGGHWDVGHSFPWDEVLAMAAGEAPAKPDEQEANDNMVLNDTRSGGYWVAFRDGAVHAYKGAPWLGNATPYLNGKPCIGIADRPDDDGYALVADFGNRDIRFYEFGYDGANRN